MIEAAQGAADSVRPKIRAVNVQKTYVSGSGEVRALDGLDISADAGEFCCVVGPSGCGKSTFLRILAGLETPSGGEVRILQEDNNRALATVAFQEYSIFPWKTVEANVAFGLRMRGASRSDASERARDWIRRLGLDGFEKAYPGTLSGGMKQRVSLARALALDPEVLLLDEPFAALDAQLRQLLQEELLNQWQQEQGRTAVFVTHSLDEAILLGDRVVLMSARPGRVKRTFDVPFPRPRSFGLRESAEFTRLRHEIWDELRGEVEISVGGGTAVA